MAAKQRVSVACRLESAQAAKLDAYALERGITRSAAMAELVEFGLAVPSARVLIKKIDERFERNIEISEVLAIVHDDVQQIREALGLLSPASSAEAALRVDLEAQIREAKER